MEMPPPVQKKAPRPMNPAEVERNKRRKEAFAEIRALNPKAKWTNASKLVSFRNKGKSANAEDLLRSIRNSVNAAGVAVATAAAVANKPAAATVKKAKKEVAFAALNAAKNAVTRNNRNKSRNAVKTNLTSRMSVHGKKPSAILIQQLLGLRRAGKNNTAFLAEVDRVAAAAAAEAAAKTIRREEKAAKKAEKNATKTARNARKAAKANKSVRVANNMKSSVWKNLKAQVNKNVEATGMKINAINRRALAHLRKTNPNVTVANFMKNRRPRKRLTKKNHNNLIALFNNPVLPPKENIGNYKPKSNNANQQRLNELLRNSE